MRYALDGAGYRTSTMTTINSTGCSSTCTGFELTRNLSFTSNASYRTPANRVEYTVGSDWEPIGTFDNRFNTRFEGNGHTISNLRINRGSMNDIGLFGYAGVRANIANIGLRNVRIIGARLVGSLTGANIGSITSSYATDPRNLVGVSRPLATITNSSTQTIVQLQTTTTGIYSDWSIDVWDFGTENDLPTLRNVPELIRIRARVFLEGPLQ